MYIKIVGFLLLLFGGGMAGMKKAQALSEREQLLRSLRESLQVFQNEIEFKTEILEKALERASSRDGKGVFSEGMKNISKYGAAKGFIMAAKKIDDEKTREIMCAFGRGLEAEDKFALLKSTQLVALRLEEEREIAAKVKIKLSKVYISTGFLAGAAVGIMFI